MRIPINEYQIADISKLDRVETGNNAIDMAMGGYLFPSLNVWSGQRAAGKSTMLYQTLIPALEKDYNVFIYTGELDAGMFKLWFYNQIATERHLEAKVDHIRRKQNSGAREKEKDTTKEERLQFVQKKIDGWAKDAVNVLLWYLRWMEFWKKFYKPESMEAEWNPLFIEALQNESKISYLVDMLMFGTDEEVLDFSRTDGRR